MLTTILDARERNWTFHLRRIDMSPANTHANIPTTFDAFQYFASSTQSSLICSRLRNASSTRLHLAAETYPPNQYHLTRHYPFPIIFLCVLVSRPE